MTDPLTERMTIRVSKREKEAIYRIFGPEQSVSRNVVAYLLNAKDASAEAHRRKTLSQLAMINSLIENHLSTQCPTGFAEQLDFLKVILNCRALMETIKANAP